MRYLTTLFFLICFLHSKAQFHTVREFTTDDGLPSSTVFEVKQDKDGFYFISTMSGLAKYDGYQFSMFSMEDGPMYKNVWWSYEDKDGKIWAIGLGRKAWFVEGDSVKYKDLNFPGVNEKVAFTKLMQDDQGFYWLRKTSSFFRFKGDEFKKFSSKELFAELNENPCYSTTKGSAQPRMIQGKDHALYFIHTAPLSVWKTDSSEILKLVFQYEDVISNSLETGQTDCESVEHLKQNETTIITRSFDSIYTIHQGQLKGYLNGKTLDLGTFPCAHLTGDKQFRVINLSGKYAFIYPKKSFVTDLNFNHLPEYDLLSDYNINTVYEDREGGIWISTTGQGLIYFTKNSLAVTNYPDLMDETPAVKWMVSAPDNPETKLLGFRNGGLVLLHNGERKTMRFSPPENGKPSWILHDLVTVGNHVIALVGNFEVQVLKWKDIIGGKVKPIQRLHPDHLHYLTVAPDANIYAAGYSGTYSISRQQSGAFSWTKMSNHPSFYAFPSGNGSRTIQSTNGLFMSTANGDSLLLAKSFSINRLRWDNSGTPWLISGRSSGIKTLHGQKLTKIDALNGYSVKDLKFESDATMWAATNEGLIQFSYNRRDSTYHQTRKFTKAHGLPTNSITCLALGKDKLYVGTAKGLSIIDRRKVSSDASNNRVMLTSISSKGEKLPTEAYYDLSPDFNAIDINYVFVSPKSNGQITYEYKLDGIDSDWKQTKETSISYPFLPAGTYSFQLKALDINSVPSSNVIRFDVKVNQIWWKTTWFWVLLIAVALLLILGFFFIRLRQLEKRERERTEMNNRIAELRLNALQSQMNPHFVFNVLNSIQDFFLSNNILEANRYLSDFSKLMRLFLESSKDKYVTLTTEIKLLNYYVDLERMRLKQKFEFEVEIDDKIDPDDYKIPTMILQPILENAILHGLRHKDGNGKLSVSFGINNSETLIISVDDNGIGRKKSAEIYKTRRKDHTSRATAIIEERLGIINSSSENRIEMDYIDLEEETDATGTRVVLKADLKVNR